MREEEFEQCVRRICDGDRSGLKDIYTEYLPYLYRIVYGMVQKKEVAEDITADFFVRFWTLAPKYKPGNGHKGYLATIIRNMTIDHIRKEQREILVDITEEVEMESTDSGIENVVENITLQEALKKLKPDEKQIIDMKVLSEMTFKEIAEILHIPMGTVTWKYQEGIKKLRRCGYE